MPTLHTSCKHELLTVKLRRELKTKSFPENRFPTVKFLMQRYNVSQATLTKAMAPLFEEGLLYSVTGKGTFVRNKAAMPVQNSLKMIFCVVSSQAVFNREYNSATWFAMQEIFSGIAQSTREHGSTINLITIPVDGPEFRHLAKMPNAAFIFLEYECFESQIEYCIKKNLPYAVYAKHHKLTRKIKQVWLDTEQAQYDAVSHLIARGHRNIAFIGDKKNSSRFKGYCAALHDAGVICRQDYMVFNEHGNEELSYEQTMDLLKKHPELTAFACSTDIRAVGALKAVQDSTRKIPQTAVTGVDDVSRIYYPVPENLTSVHLPFREIGEALTNTAFAEEKDLCIRMAPSLMVRQTS